MFKIFSKQTEIKHDFINTSAIIKPIINEIFTLEGNIEFLLDRKRVTTKNLSCSCDYHLEPVDKYFSLSENIDSDNLKNIIHFANLVGKDIDDIIRIKKRCCHGSSWKILY